MSWEIAELREEVENLKQILLELKQEVEQLKSDYSYDFDHLDSRINDLERRIDGLEGA